MQVLHLGLGLHSKAPPELHIGYFETTLHLGIAFKVGLSLKVLPKSLMGYFEMIWIWLLHLALGFHIILQYPHMYLFSLTKNLALSF